MTTNHLFALALAGFALLGFVFLIGYVLFMVWTMVRDGWRAAWGSSPHSRTALVRPGVWPPPPEAGYVCDGQEYKRIPYGRESGVRGASSVPCPECDVGAGHLHGRGCGVEQCPVCSGSVAACDCEYDRFSDPNAPTTLVAPMKRPPQATRWSMTVGTLAGLLATLANGKHLTSVYFWLFLASTLINAGAAVKLWRKYLQSTRPLR